MTLGFQSKINLQTMQEERKRDAFCLQKAFHLRLCWTFILGLKVSNMLQQDVLLVLQIKICRNSHPKALDLRLA